MAAHRLLSVRVIVPALCGVAAALAVHYLFDIRYLRARVAEGNSATDPAVIWLLFLYRALAIFALSLLPPLFTSPQQGRVSIPFATGVVGTYALLGLMPATNLWPIVVAIAVVVTAVPALAGGGLIEFLKRPRH